MLQDTEQSNCYDYFLILPDHNLKREKLYVRFLNAGSHASNISATPRWPHQGFIKKQQHIKHTALYLFKSLDAMP
jgi:hypothetical protein